MTQFFTIDFALDLSDPDPFAKLPWNRLSPRDYSPQTLQRARYFFSQNAFNEYASALAMSQLLTALGQAGVPIPLQAQAATFPAEELSHISLCARVAARLGGGVPIPFDPSALVLPAAPLQTAFLRATSWVLRVCCLGEAVAQPLLAGNLRAATHPLTRAVLGRIVADETRHARFGWRYLDWATLRLTAADRSQLADEVSQALAGFADLLTARPHDEGSAAAGLGWISHAEWRTLATQTIAENLLVPLLVVMESTWSGGAGRGRRSAPKRRRRRAIVPGVPGLHVG